MILMGVSTACEMKGLGMKFRSLRYGIAAVVISCVVPRPTVAQGIAEGSNQINRTSGSAAEAAIKAAEAKPTPRTADGHPDLNGFWTYPQPPKSAHVDANGNLYIDVPRSNGGRGAVI